MKLLIVYNANAGLLAGAMDSLHKLFAPASYPCKLCAITYGLTSMKREWRDFLVGLGMATVFHHRPDFRTAYPQAAGWPLPLIAIEQDGALWELVTATELAALPDLAALIALAQARLQRL